MLKTVAVADPPELLDLVDDLRHAPGDERLTTALAGLLGELGPSRVRRHKLPAWFAPCWRRLVPPAPGTSRVWGGRTAGAVRHEFQQWWSARGGVTSSWDHWGAVTIAGLDCVVTEPYRYANVDPASLLRPLAEALPGCAHAWAPRGSHNEGTVRGILFPPLIMPPPRRWARARTRRG